MATVDWGQSSRHELDRGLTPPSTPEAAYILDRCRRSVLGGIDAFDGVANAFAARPHRPDADDAVAHLDRSKRLVKKRPVPPAALQCPRTGKHAPIVDDGPDGDEAMPGSRAGPDAEKVACVNRGKERAGKALALHGYLTITAPMLRRCSMPLNAARSLVTTVLRSPPAEAT